MTLSGGATVARIRPFAAINFNAGTHNVTIRLALPQVELGAFPTMPILPAAGTQVAATRAVDGRSLTVVVSGAATLHVEQVSVVAILVASGNHQQAEAQHLGKAVLDALGHARIVDASGETRGHAKARLDLTQRQ